VSQAIDRIVAGNGYYDRAETLWALLMVCDRCDRRAIDCLCREPDGWTADSALVSVGRELNARDEAAPPRGGTDE
jgi:hypothetical protein